MSDQRFITGKRFLLALLLLAGCAAQPVATTQSSAEPMPADAAACVSAISAEASIPGRPLDADAIRVVNWNIQKGGDPAWAADLKALDPLADLMILQEASPGLEVLGNVATEHHLSFAEGFKGIKRQTGVMTLSRAMPLDECQLVAREPWLGTRKATLVTRYSLTDSDETLLVLNIHGVNFSVGARELAEQIANAEAIIAAHTGPVLFSGDFNTWRHGRARLLEEAATRLGLESLDYDDDHRKRFMGWPLDHILTRGLVAVGATSHDVESSDHNPMTVEFRVEPSFDSPTRSIP